MSIASSSRASLCTAIRSGELSENDQSLTNFDSAPYWETSSLCDTIRGALDMESNGMGSCDSLPTSADLITAYDEAGRATFDHLETFPFANCETLEECITIVGDASFEALKAAEVAAIMTEIESELNNLEPVEFDGESFEPSVFNFVDYKHYQDFELITGFKDDQNVHYHAKDGKVFSIIELNLPGSAAIKIDYTLVEDGE